MKKRIIGLLALASALAFCFVLAGCGDNSKNFVGCYELTGMNADGEAVSESDMAMLKSFGFNIYVDLNEDKSAQLTMTGEDVATGTWKATDKETCKITLSDTTLEGTVSEGTLTLKDGDDTMIFKKIDPSEKVDLSSDGNFGSQASGEIKEYNKVIADDDLCTIMVIGAEDYEGDPAFLMVFANNTSDKTLLITNATHGFTINGKSSTENVLWVDDLEPGETTEDYLWFEDTPNGSIDDLVNVKGSIEVCDESTDEVLREYPLDTTGW